MASKRKCTLCPSHLYEYCPNCKDNKKIEPWRLLFDTENCRDAYHIISEFAFGRLTASDAKQQLDQIVVPNKEDMQPALRKNLEDLYAQAAADPTPIPDTTEESPRASAPSYPEDNTEENDPTNSRRRRRMYNHSYD